MDYSKLTKVADSKITDSNGVEEITSEMVAKWNDYCEENDYYDDIVYSMDDFDELMGSQSPLEIAQRMFFGNFNPNHEWFWFNGYANLESNDFILEQPQKGKPQIIDWDVVMNNTEESVDEDVEDDVDEEASVEEENK